MILSFQEAHYYLKSQVSTMLCFFKKYPSCVGFFWGEIPQNLKLLIQKFQ